MIHLAPICQNREISGEISSCWTGSLELPYYVLLYYYIATLYSIQYTHKVPNSSPLPFYHHSTKYGSSYSISYVFQKDTPPKTNIGLWKTHYLKMYFLLNMGIFYCHVTFRGMYIFNLIPNPLQPQPPVFQVIPQGLSHVFFSCFRGIRVPLTVVPALKSHEPTTNDVRFVRRPAPPRTTDVGRGRREVYTPRKINIP